MVNTLRLVSKFFNTLSILRYTFANQKLLMSRHASLSSNQLALCNMLPQCTVVCNRGKAVPKWNKNDFEDS